MLDGDTIVDHGKAIHIRGMDAPELGPWAKCWAEAALAKVAKDVLEAKLLEKRWHISDPRKEANGLTSADLIDQEGYSIVDEMQVGGLAAATTGHWSWCTNAPPLHAVEEDEKPPIGPQLWWPSGKVFDPRAAD